MNANDDPGRVVSDWLHEFGRHTACPGTSTRSFARRPRAVSARPGRASKGGSPCRSTLRLAPAPRLGLISLLVSSPCIALAAIAALIASARASIRCRRPSGLARNGVDRLRRGRATSMRYDPATGVTTPSWSPAPRTTSAPLFSRDGSQILFSAGPDGASPSLALVVADVDGSHAHEVVEALTDCDVDRLVADRREGGVRLVTSPARRSINDRECPTAADRPRSTWCCRSTVPVVAGPDGIDILFRGPTPAFRREHRDCILVKADGSSSPRPVSCAVGADRRASAIRSSSLDEDARDVLIVRAVDLAAGIGRAYHGLGRHARGSVHVLDAGHGQRRGDPAATDRAGSVSAGRRGARARRTALGSCSA